MPSVNQSKEQNDEEEGIEVECLPLFRKFTSGRVERLIGTATAPPPPNSKDVPINSNPKISARLFLPSHPKPGAKLPILIYYHGGGFCIESAFSPTYHNFLTKMADEAGMVVVSVDYRLAPENLLPAAYEDAWVGMKWVFGVGGDMGLDQWVREWGDLGRVWVGGDSAGANIAHHMALRSGATNGGEAGSIKVEGMILLHAYFWGSDKLRNETTEPGVRDWIDQLWKVIAPPEMQSLDHPMINPIAKEAPSLEGLGCNKIIVCVAEKDPLVQRGRAYYEAVMGSGWKGDIELVESHGEEHVFHLNNPQGRSALDLARKLVAFVTKNN